MGEKTAGRIAYIDELKGVAIVLVVLGHIVSHDARQHWAYNFIYSFHMPLFMFLTGCTAAISYRRKKSTDLHYIGKRFVNIMLPYLAWICTLPIFYMRSVIRVDWREVVYDSLIRNEKFWFLPTAFGLIVVYIGYRELAELLFGKRKQERGEDSFFSLCMDLVSCFLVIVVLAVLMLVTHWQLLRDMLGYAILFFAAVMYIEHEGIYRLFMNKYVLFFAIGLYAALIRRFDFDKASIVTSLLRMVLGLCMIVILLQLFNKVRLPGILRRQCALLGKNTMLTYICHGINGAFIMTFDSSFITLLWYVIVSVLTCYVCSLLAAALDRIPVVRTLYLGKTGVYYAGNK